MVGGIAREVQLIFAAIHNNSTGLKVSDFTVSPVLYINCSAHRFANRVGLIDGIPVQIRILEIFPPMFLYGSSEDFTGDGARSTDREVNLGMVILCGDFSPQRNFRIPKFSKMVSDGPYCKQEIE